MTTQVLVRASSKYSSYSRLPEVAKISKEVYVEFNSRILGGYVYTMYVMFRESLQVGELVCYLLSFIMFYFKLFWSSVLVKITILHAFGILKLIKNNKYLLKINIHCLSTQAQKKKLEPYKAQATQARIMYLEQPYLRQIPSHLCSEEDLQIPKSRNSIEI